MEDEVLITYIFTSSSSGALLIMDGIDLNNAEECIYDIVEDGSDWKGVELTKNIIETLTPRVSIKLWAEGYATNGNRSGATVLGEYLAKDFDDAMRQYMLENPKIDIEKSGSGSGNYSSWACRIYDNEKQARKYFG
jgi:hypothetical protein